MPLNRLTEISHRFAGRVDAIDRWLDSRKNLLVRYLQLTGAPHADTALPGRAAIAGFCDALVDYVSAGHFEIYEQLLEQAEHCGSDTVERYRLIYPQIAASTDAALAFNDRYGGEGSEEQMASFDRDLAALGSQLVDRFDLEDALIACLFPEADVA